MTKKKKKVVFGLLGHTQDKKDNDFRPTINLAKVKNKDKDFLIDRFHLLYYYKDNENFAHSIADEFKEISPNTEVQVEFLKGTENWNKKENNAWDFAKVYECLYEFVQNYTFTEDEEYFVHITTGTETFKICWSLLIVSNFLKAKVVQSIPSGKKYNTVDFDLEQYDSIRKLFAIQRDHDIEGLKFGVKTNHKGYNQIIEQISKISLKSKKPILLTGKTGTGKTELAKKLHGFLKERKEVTGELVEMNCACVKGDTAMSELFGHEKGAFTGATEKYIGKLEQADKGILFLDEIGELGLEQQAMLLKAIEEKKFYRLKGQKEVNVDFRLIAATNRNLDKKVVKGKFRDDLLARIDTWSFELPTLAERSCDLEEYLEYSRKKWKEENNSTFNFDASSRKKFLDFARSDKGLWLNNFRDYSNAINRMATLAENGIITVSIVENEIKYLQEQWSKRNKKLYSPEESVHDPDLLNPLDYKNDIYYKQLCEEFGEEKVQKFHQDSLLHFLAIIRFCKGKKSAADAGRALFPGKENSSMMMNRCLKALNPEDQVDCPKVDWKMVRKIIDIVSDKTKSTIAGKAIGFAHK
jgi:transcriptional regulatory protein RtcR